MLFLLMGISGLYGSIRRKKGNCLFGIYMIGVLIFFFLFLGACIFFFVGPEAIFGADCKHGSKTSLIADLYGFSNEASTVLCKSCQCYVKDSDSFLKTYLTQNQFTNFTSD